MAAKVKYSKDQIIEAAFLIASKEGLDQITIRNVAKSIGSSIAPIYVNYESVNELKQDVIQKAFDIYDSLIETYHHEDYLLRFAHASIQFSKQFPKLYDSLLLGDYDNMIRHSTNEKMQAVLREKYQFDQLSDEHGSLFVTALQALQVGLSIMSRKQAVQSMLNDEKILQILDGVGNSMMQLLQENASNKNQ